ncbi:Putative cytochrome P450 137 [Mycobacterium simulans]|uniref:Cytochrome P450 137 n=1 Tax=Mycobacterium simulans TaxID=627089 RepID=A0A7Z7N7G6_9MYCO|nr:cytochrome P450 [Mycobacterium simulans]SOJ52520.1 Putative cytochrome P450 137 [Mycobacterium simulans]
MSVPQRLNRMPGPWEPSLVQSLQWLTRPDFYQRMADRYGPVFRMRFLYWGDIAVFTTSNAAQQILTLPRTVAHSGMEAMREGMGPHAVVLLNEDEHRRMRKLLMPPLMGSRLKQWEVFIERRTMAEVSRWPVNEPFAIRPIAEEITLDVIAKIVFGMRDAARAQELRALLPALYNWSPVTALGFISPLGRLDLGGWSPWGRFRRKRDRIDELLYSEIALRRREFAACDDRAEASDDRSDLLSVLLLARDEDGNGLTDAEVRDQLVAMLLAGHETSATAIAWAVERLTHNASVLERLLGSLEEGDTAYLDAVIKETLRSRPVAHEVPRVLAQDAEIDGWALPAGTGVGIAIPVLHHDPMLYREPDKFRPERFLDGNEPDPSAWLPFGGGVRRCPGANLAMLEMRVVLTTILRHVRLEPDRPEPETPTAYHVTTVPARGGRVVVTERLRRHSEVVS